MNMITTPTLQHEEAVTALCIWEHMLDTSDSEGPWDDFRDGHGAFEARDLCIHLAPHCERFWRNCINGTALQENTDLRDFDWGFVPAWLNYCVDWDVDGYPAPLADSVSLLKLEAVFGAP